MKKIAFIGLLACLLAGLGCRLQALEKMSDTLHLFSSHIDTVRLRANDVLRLSALYDSADKDDWHYIYRWNTGERTDAIHVKFNGERKILYTGQRVSAIHWPDEYDTLRLDAGSDYYDENFYRYIADPMDDTVVLRAPDMEGTNIRYGWTNENRRLPYTGQYAIIYRDMWNNLGWEYTSVFSCQASAVSDVGVSTVLQSTLMLNFNKKGNGFVQTPQESQLHDYNIWSMPEWTQIYARLGDTLHFFSELNPTLYPNHANLAQLEFVSYDWTVEPGKLIDLLRMDIPHDSDSVVNIYFKDNIYRSTVELVNTYRYPTGSRVWSITDHYVYWGIKPDAEIESDSVWVAFFPQYPYSELKDIVNVCLPPDAPLPAEEDTVHIFNLGPWNRELEYVDYVWFDGTKDVSGADSIVGTDSVFAYLFGRMDSVNPYLYEGQVITRATVDSLWQDSCGCFIPCTDAACYGHDTVRIYLHLLPSLRKNVFLPRDSVLCAHLDLELNLPQPAVEDYHCYWLDKDSIEMPYGHDTTRYTVQGLRGLDGFGAGTDTREPRFFQLRLDHKLCGVSFFDTLLVYDQVRPHFELLCHDTLICFDEPVELDSLSPHVYRPFYTFEWNDGKKGSAYTFTDPGLYTLRFFVDKNFAVCGYDTASDTIRVLWSDPAMTLITLSDTSFCESLSVTLDASVPCPSTRYSWQEGTLPNPEEDVWEEDSIIFTSPIIKVDEEMTLSLFVVDTLGCMNTKQIEVKEDDCSPKLEIPNVFTPNGDGVNDVWRFKQLEKCMDVVIEVVDRWGQPVLKKKVPSANDFEWNGRVNNTGARLPDGPYFYMVTYKNLYGKSKVQSGSITILGTSE